MKKVFLLCWVILATVACSKSAVKPTEPVPVEASCPCPDPNELPPIQLPEKQTTTGVEPAAAPLPTSVKKAAQYDLLKPASWQDLDSLLQDNLSAAWPAWLQSCTSLIKQTEWKAVCSVANTLKKPTSATIADYFSTHFSVYRAQNEDGSTTGLVTGYYQPLLKGSKEKSSKYPYPLYRQPDDLITVELADSYPSLKYKRVRGKLVGNKLVPYSTRAEIDAKPSPLAGTEIFWINDIVDVFFLQIQGSGVVQLENGTQVQVGYANQNGHSYQSIGRLLVKRGELSLEKASMQGIKNWARNNLDKLQALLNSNPSYVFFRELPAGLPG
ncbi:MAG: MltA domain-containing protein, partial [Methylophilaceae bacterium]